MPRYLLSALVSLTYTLIFVYTGTLAEPFAYRHKWYPRRWRPGPYCGTASQPLQDTPELLRQCREQCASTGQQLQRQLHEGAQTLELEVPSSVNNCPASGLRYQSNRWGDFVVMCRAHPHSQAIVVWGSREAKIMDSWPSTAALDNEGKAQAYWFQAWSAHYSGDDLQAVQFCEKMRALARNELDDLLAQAQLALGQPQQALKVCETSIAAAKKEEALATELAFEQLRWQCLLELGKADQVLAESPDAVTRCMAQLQLDQTKEASQTLESIQDNPLFSAFALLALQRYPECRKRSEQVLKDKGWQSDYAGNAIVAGVLSDWLGGAPQDQARDFLRQGLAEAPKTWPYPLLRYLNGELCEQEIFEAAGSDASRRVETNFTVGVALLAGKRDQKHARELLREAAGHGYYFEGMAARCLLKSL